MPELISFDLPLIGNTKESDIPSPEEYNYWRSRKNRIFYIDYIIDENYSLVELGKEITLMNVEEMNIPREELKPIYIFLMSGGGDVYQSNYFCDLLISSRIPIITVAMGITMSAAFDILLAGHKRYAFKHSQTMVHAGYINLQGTQSEVEEAQKNNKLQIAKSKEYILSRTLIDEKTFNKNKNKDWYISGEDLVKYHIVDKLIDNIEEIFE